MRHRKSWDGFTVGDSVLVDSAVQATIIRIDSFTCRGSYSNYTKIFQYTIRTDDNRTAKCSEKHLKKA